MAQHQFVFRMNSRSIGLIGLFITIIGLFLPWLEVQYYYYPLVEETVRTVASYIYPPYYPTYYELGIMGIGWNTVLASLLAAYALFTETKRRSGFLAVSSLTIFYNVGSVLAMYYLFNYYYYYYYTALGVGLFVCLFGGIFFLIAALLDLSHAAGKVTFCKKCGASLSISESQKINYCPYCGEGLDYLRT